LAELLSHLIKKGKMSGKYALIIGNTDYTDPGLAKLSAPGKDAEDFARVLRDKEIGAFDDVKVIVNEPSASVIEAIDEFFDQKKPDDMLVFYFSGHGIRDEAGSLYLAFMNTIRSRLRSTAIKSEYIREAMDQSRSKRQVLILDCCNSGAFPQGTKAELGGAMGMTRAFQGYGRFVLTASDATQFAWEGDKVIGETDNSLFTHFLVKGLEGEADNDGDGRITVDELYDYAYDQISRVTPNQTPTKSAAKQEGEIVLRQNMRIEDIKPVALPDELINEIEDLRPLVREGAVQRLEKIIKGKNIGMARSAIEALEKIVADENTTRRVAQLATQALEFYRQAEQKVEAERKAKEEAERLAILEAEEERLAREKAEAERKAKEESERLALAKAEQEAAEREAMRLKAEREATEKAARESAEKVAKEKADKLVAEREAARVAAESEAAREKAEHAAALKAEREAAKLAARKKAEREAAQKAENEAMELAARRKAEREAKEKATAISGKTTQPALQRQPILKWAIIGIIGLCVIATGAWGISYLASSVPPTPTERLQIKAPGTDIPKTKEIATELTNTSVPTVSIPDETLQQSATWSNLMSCQKAASGKLNINSPWLSNEIIPDGKITTAQEWSDAVCLDLTMDQPRTGAATLSSRWWFKNDGQWLYLLARVPSVASFGDSAFINYFWPYPFVNRWEHSDYGGLGLDGIAFDGFGWDNANWSGDTLASPPGKTNVYGGARGDTTYIWFEFKKALNSGDSYDWDWAQGQTLGTSQNGSLGVGIYDSTLGTYFGKSIQLHLGTP